MRVPGVYEELHLKVVHSLQWFFVNWHSISRDLSYLQETLWPFFFFGNNKCQTFLIISCTANVCYDKIIQILNSYFVLKQMILQKIYSILDPSWHPIAWQNTSCWEGNHQGQQFRSWRPLCSFQTKNSKVSGLFNKLLHIQHLECEMIQCHHVSMKFLIYKPRFV